MEYNAFGIEEVDLVAEQVNSSLFFIEILCKNNQFRR